MNGICPKCKKLLIVLPVSVVSEPLKGATGKGHMEMVEVCRDCEPEKYKRALSELGR